MLPITATLGVKRRIEGATDAHGNPVVSYAEPTDWRIHGLQPGANAEPGQPNRDLSEIVWTVYAPANDEAPGEYDLVVVDGEDFEVEGRPSDWTRGPWPNPVAGLVVELRRAEG